MTTAYIQLENTTCCVCGVVFAVPQYMLQNARANAGTLYCPSGHSLTWFETEADRLRKQLAQATSRNEQIETRLRQERERNEAAERRVSAARGQLTKLKNRIGAGACPCCGRFFQELSSHMLTKHPEFRKEDAESATARKES